MLIRVPLFKAANIRKLTDAQNYYLIVLSPTENDHKPDRTNPIHLRVPVRPVTSINNACMQITIPNSTHSSIPTTNAHADIYIF